jgi:hypothetical protein
MTPLRQTDLGYEAVTIKGTGVDKSARRESETEEGKKEKGDRRHFREFTYSVASNRNRSQRRAVRPQPQQRSRSSATRFPIGAKTFTVPPAALLHLPPGQSSLSVANRPNTLLFGTTSGPQLDFGLAGTGWTSSTTVVYQ